MDRLIGEREVEMVAPGRPCPACGESMPSGDDNVCCCDCHNRAVREYQAARRASLAAEPRCEVDGCRRRGAYKAGHESVLLCGAHLRRAQAVAARAGVFGMGVQWARETVLAAAGR
ncbi:MAG: hypothetical protein ACYCZN_01805 [Candidatus Dormibacteria bacterium]